LALEQRDVFEALTLLRRACVAARGLFSVETCTLQLPLAECGFFFVVCVTWLPTLPTTVRASKFKMEPGQDEVRACVVSYFITNIIVV